jgi:uncharacterized protein YraI
MVILMKLKIGLSLLVVSVLSFSFVLLSNAQEPVDAEVVPDYLFVRANPSPSAEQLGSFTRGTVLQVEGRETNSNDGGSWVYVTPDGGGTSGWVLSNFLLFPENYNIGVLPVMNGTTAPSASAPSAPQGSAPAAASTLDGLPATTSEAVNFRNGPELTFEVLRQLPANTDLVIVGRNANGVWLQAAEGEDIGWVFYSLVDVDGDVNSVPVTTGGGAPRPQTTPAAVGTPRPNTPAPAAANTTADSGNRPTSLGRDASVFGNSDGRLNPDIDLGGALVFCVNANHHTNRATYSGGGIAVYLWETETIALFASEAQIQAAGVDTLILSEGGYSLGRDPNGDFMLYGEDSSGKEFTFRWSGCQSGQRL